MNILRNDKVILTKEMGNLKMVGETYEVANVVEDRVVLRDAKTKVAVGVIDIVDFWEYFKKPEDVKRWTNWTNIVDQQGNSVGTYRTNMRKVQVRLSDGTRTEVCCKKSDSFSLGFGINYAYERCTKKYLKRLEAKYEKSLKSVRADISECEHRIKQMINAVYKDEE